MSLSMSAIRPAVWDFGKFGEHRWQWGRHGRSPGQMPAGWTPGKTSNHRFTPSLRDSVSHWRYSVLREALFASP